MRLTVILLVIGLLAAGCSSETVSTAAPTTTPLTLPSPTTSTRASTTTSPPTTGPATTTTALVVPPPECFVELPATDDEEVRDVELAVFADATSPTRLWSLSLGDRPVEMDTLGDRVYVATFDGFVASFDLDPCGLDWLSSVAESVTGVVAIDQGVFVASRASLAVIDRIEGTAASFPLEDGLHEMAAGPDILAVSNGTAVVLYDYVTRQAASLDIGDRVDSLASAGQEGVVVGHGITVELRTWLGAALWARDLPDAVANVSAVEDTIVAGLVTGGIVVLETDSGEVRWEKAFAPGSSIEVGPHDHGELHVLEIEFGAVARHHHLAAADGSTVVVNESPALQTFAEYDDGLLLVVDEGQVTARSLLEQDVWTISTGADGLGRFTEVDVTAGLIVALSFSAEQF